MCGIAGYVRAGSSVTDPAIIRRMTDVIRHRGPDDNGFYEDDSAALGQRRLSIIDLSGGHQPMANETGSMWIVYNGEIFNHTSIRRELEKAGHRYGSHCDTETILHAYEEFGAGCVSRFRGMFAFAIWDKQKKQLFCGRDRLGIKPFYYFWDGNTFVFGSEIKAVLEHPAVKTRFNEAALPEYLAFGYLSGEETLFAGIRKLMPGHTLQLNMREDRPELHVVRYWDVPVPEQEEQHSDREWVEECRRRLEETVRMRLMSDVPLGMFLSGGVDSSAIAALIKRMTSGPVKTFSVGYSEGAYSELGYAREVADTIGTDHHEVVVGMEQFFDVLPQLIWHEDEPITWPSSVSLHFVSALAAKQVKVVLTGEGSDELFGGYVRYRWTEVNLRMLGGYRRVVPVGLRDTLRRQIATNGMLPADLRRKLSHSFLGREETVESLHLDNFYSAFPSAESAALLKGGNRGAYDEFLRYWNAQPGASLLRRMLYADQKTYLVELLMKQDQMSMSTSIESRVPFLDHTFVEFAMRVPDNLKIRGKVQKYILKEAVADLLPAGIIGRKKMGFPTPLVQWLRELRAERLFQGLLDPNGFIGCYLDLELVRGLLEQHRAGTHDNTDRIWRLLNLQIWGDLFFTGRRERWAEGLRVTASRAL